MSAKVPDTRIQKQAYFRLLLQQSGVALCYLLLSKIVLGYYSTNGMVTVLWPASGVALAAILLGGKRYWIGIFAGALFVELWVAGHSLVESLPIATSAALEAFLAARVLKRGGLFSLDLSTSRDFFLLIFAGIVAPSVCALTGVTVLVLGGDIPQSEYLSALAHWWMGETLGIVLVTSTILVWRKPATGWLEIRRALEVASILGLTLLIGQIIFLDWLHDTFGSINRGYWLYLVVTLGAVRLGRHGVLAILWIIIIQALLGATNGLGFFKDDLARTQLGNLWFYTTILTVVGMSLATLIRERLQVARKLRESESTYRSLFENMMNSVVHARVIFENDKPVDLEYITTNPAFAVVTGITQPVIGRRVSEVIPGYCENNPETLKVFGRVATTGVSTQWEHYLRELDRWFYFNIYSPARGEVFIITQNITERKEAELALQASEKRFSDIVAASADWTWEMDAQGRYTYASSGVTYFLGYTPEEVIGKTPFDFMPSAEATRVGTEFYALAAHRKPFRDVDNIKLHKNGSLRHMQTNGMPIIDPQGELVGYRGMDKDITASKLAELKMLESESRFRTLFDNAAVSILIHDRETGEIIVANRRAVESYGCETAAELMQNYIWLEPPYSHEDALDKIHQAANDGPQRFEWKHRNRDGEIFWDNVLLNRISLNGVDRVLAVTTDISARKAAEDALRKRDRYQRALLDNFPFMVWLKDKDSRILAANKVYAKVAKVADPDDLVGKTDLDYWEPALAEQYRSDDREVLSSGQPKTVEEEITEAGRRFWIETYKSPVELDGQIIGTVGFARDISARKATEMQLRKLSLAVEQSPESIAITDLDANIEYVNDAFLRITGYSREDIIGKNQRILHSGKTPRSTYEALWKNLTEGKTWQGEFYNKRKDGSEYIERVIISPIRQEDGRITHYLAIKEDITPKMRAQAEIHRLANYDTLTGLPNRAMLLDRIDLTLATTRRAGQLSALISFNIDRFKTINDAGGHLMGDAILKAVSERLSHILREVDVVARIAGDEFGILLTDLASQQKSAANFALHVSKKLHAIMHAPFSIGDVHITLTASLGITLFPEDNKDTPLDILRRANTSLHHSKSRGGAQTAFYESVLDNIARQRFDIERELQQCIESGELRVYLQPQVEATGKTVGAEALVRWQHPQRGLLPPNAFIPIAEESNLVTDIDLWVFTEVCRLLAHENIAALPLRIAVNISPRHFHQPDFVDQIKRVLASTGADPTHLTLEITEGVVIDNIIDVVAKMSELSSMGIHFSMDDFGTGYSSLSYLKRLPIHELKIDKSFIQDLTTDTNDAGLVETILSVAKHLHLKVVAEGVETAEQAAFLNQRGPVIHQGYLFGKPEPVEKFFEKLAGQLPS